MKLRLLSNKYLDSVVVAIVCLLLVLLWHHRWVKVASGCSGASPNWTMNDTTSASAAACFAETLACGDTITSPSGSSTWSTTLTLTPPTGCAAYQGVTFVGGSVVTGSGDFNGGTSGVVSATDNTTITITGQFNIGTGAHATSNTAFVYVTGFTFNIQANNAIQMQGTDLQVGGRIHHNHFIGPTSNDIAVQLTDGYSWVDHNYFQDTTASAPGFIPFNFYGDFPTAGYKNWSDATSFGSLNADYVEANYFTTTHTNSEGIYDGFSGCTLVVRFNTMVGFGMGGTHGTDSGGYRGCVHAEVYGNNLTNNTGTNLQANNTRSGSLLYFNNVLNGTSNYGSGIDLQYYRITVPSVGSGTWGTAATGLNWLPISTTLGGNGSLSVVNSLNAPDWTASHAYTCSPAAPCFIGPLLHNTGNSGSYTGSGGFNYMATASGTSAASASEPNPWNQTVGGTQADNTMTWTNIGGGTAAPAHTTGEFLSATPDSICSTGASCTYFFDSLGASAGTYPYRDQPGRIGNQVLFPNYQWGNTGVNSAGATLLTDAGTNTVITANRDFYNYTGSFTGATGVGVGTLGNIPATCTTGVAYWATDQGSWNTSGNGQGSGVLYVCGPTNTWTVGYTPQAYPLPGTVAAGTSNALGTLGVGD